MIYIGKNVQIRLTTVWKEIGHVSPFTSLSLTFKGTG